MNRKDIVCMARGAGAVFPSDGGYHSFKRIEDLERFAKLVAAAEREECAKVCDSLNFIENGTPGGARVSNRHCAASIRARGEL